ncbi:serine peptidase [Amycolatopsis sp. GM8]|uniref:serine peptidase n=1 Tax=Amycolatopsis sp. GM8 TaxID=2896530 RepID=UPI001F401F7B|nr:serine peptidase [Amycolatopsis sp. GM8]
MIRVLGVHGIGTHRYHRRTGSPEQAATALATDWFRHLGTAMPANSSVDLRVAYYAHLLHPESGPPVDEDPAMLAPAEQQLFLDWIGLLNPALDGTVEAAGDWLARTHGSATRLFALTFCRELHAYLSDTDAREAVRQTVAEAIDAVEPDVVVAHSLGSVVAYESLWAHQNREVGLLVTLGSPLAMPGVVADQLEPGDDERRPPRVSRWVNLADPGDIAAVPPGGLARRFAVDEDIRITAGMWEFQTPGAYLRSTDVTGVIFGADSIT